MLRIEKNNVEFEKIDNEYMFYNKKMEKIFVANNSASILYDLFDKYSNFDEIVQRFYELFDTDIPFQEIHNDALNTVFHFALCSVIKLYLNEDVLFFSKDEDINTYLQELYI